MIGRIVVVAGVLVLSAFIIVHSTSGNPASTGHPVTSSGTSPSAPASTATSGSAPASSPASRAQAATAAQISAWFARVHTRYAAFATDEKDLSKASGKNADISALKAVCGTLKTDVVAFQAEPPAPDSTLRVDLAHAMADYGAAAADCLKGEYGATGQVSIWATTWLDRATTRIEQFTR
ncbi:MAG TPA: hypothetical protein VKQ07_03025 [Jatrophihabitantaceae bacterium]|nr:hypothetical protein [Jatrophihabitantaceae bacterium]